MMLKRFKNLVFRVQIFSGGGVDVSAFSDPSTIVVLVTAGCRLSVVVTTGLSADGTFWSQLDLEEKEGEGEGGGGGGGGGERRTPMADLYQRLQEDLHESLEKGGEVFTPAFFSAGDVCAACFSEDKLWYRARIEQACPETVRNLAPPLMLYTQYILYI